MQLFGGQSTFSFVSRFFHCLKKKELETAAIYEAQETAEKDFENDSGEHGSYITVKMINAIRKINRDLKTAKDIDDWIAREKNLTLIYEKQQKIDERNGMLIERKFVESDVFTYLEIVKNSIEDSPVIPSGQYKKFAEAKNKADRMLFDFW